MIIWIYVNLGDILMHESKKKVSMIMEYHNHTLHNNQRHRKKEPQYNNSPKAPGRYTK